LDAARSKLGIITLNDVIHHVVPVRAQCTDMLLEGTQLPFADSRSLAVKAVKRIYAAIPALTERIEAYVPYRIFAVVYWMDCCRHLAFGPMVRQACVGVDHHPMVTQLCASHAGAGVRAAIGVSGCGGGSQWNGCGWGRLGS
jgi:hypothetical protein